MSYPTKSYTAYVKRLCALTGIPQNGLTSDEQGFFQEYFQTNIDEAWTRYSWMEICPFGEARLVGNLVQYANNYTATAGNWTTYHATVTDNQFGNPADARTTAGRLAEDATTNSHYLQSSTAVSVVPNTNYTFSVYYRPFGRTGIYLAAGSGHSSYFTLTGNGVVGTQTSCQATCNLTSNGFYLCQINFTTSASETSLVSELDLWNGVSLTYAGDGASGGYVWGWYVGQASNTPLNQLIPYNQTGENSIDTVFTVWKDCPSLTSYPRPQGYQLTPDGVMIVGSGGTGYTYGWGVTPNTAFSGAILPLNLAFLFYRPPVPDYSGAAFSTSATYAVGDTVLFTDSTSTQNFWECILATTIGQSPDSNPSSWEQIPIPEIFFKYAVYGAYSDWLRQDGQTEKADNADEQAEFQLTTQFDRQERQMGIQAPMKVATHVTSQPRY